MTTPQDPHAFSAETLRRFDKEVLVQYVSTYLSEHIRVADLNAFARFHRTQGLMGDLRRACRAADAVAKPRSRSQKAERKRRLDEISRLRAELFELTGVDPDPDHVAHRRH